MYRVYENPEACPLSGLQYLFNDTELRATLFLLRRVVYFRECQRSESSTIHFIMKIINIKYLKSHK